MLLTCPKCKTKNFLDPYPFWNFKGTTKCAGCAAVYRLDISNGTCTGGPEAVQGNKVDLLPGFAEKQDYSGISGAGLTRPAPRARKDSVCKPIPMSRNIRGNTISGHPLKKEELVGSKAKFMVAKAH
jgi:hypothetical protein